MVCNADGQFSVRRFESQPGEFFKVLCSKTSPVLNRFGRLSVGSEPSRLRYNRSSDRLGKPGTATETESELQFFRFGCDFLTTLELNFQTLVSASARLCTPSLRCSPVAHLTSEATLTSLNSNALDLSNYLVQF